METKVYKPEQIIPLLIHVLDLTAYFYGGIALKYAIKDHYQELKGKVDSLELCDTIGIGLLCTVDDQLIIRISSVVNHITSTMDAIGKTYKIDFDNIWDDQNILLLAEDFYWAFMDDEFPEEGEEDSYTDEFYAHGLDVYVNSLIRIMNRLMNLVAHGAVDFKRGNDLRCGKETSHLPALQQHEHSDVMLLLGKLGTVVNDHQHFIETSRTAPFPAKPTCVISKPT